MERGDGASGVDRAGDLVTAGLTGLQHGAVDAPAERVIERSDAGDPLVEALTVHGTF